MNIGLMKLTGFTYCWRWWIKVNDGAHTVSPEYVPDTLTADGW